MGCVMPCPGKRECDEFFDSDNVLRLCRAADTWRVMHSSPPWTTAAKLSENKSVAQGKKTNCVLLKTLLSDLYFRELKVVWKAFITHTETKKKKQPLCDWKRKMMGLVERFYLAIKAVLWNGTSGGTYGIPNDLPVYEGSERLYFSGL